MGFFYWGEPEQDEDDLPRKNIWGDRVYPRNTRLDNHEQRHKNACIRLGISWRIVHRDGVGPVIEGLGANSRQAAISLYAGYLAGGGDASGDRKAALYEGKLCGMSENDLVREARKVM